MLARSLARWPALQTMPYRLNEATGLIDYDMLETTAALFRCGACAAPCCAALCYAMLLC